MPAEKDQGDENMKSALSDDVSIAGSNKDQIIAMGGEVDDELDSFKPSAADRGDTVNDETPDPPKKEDEKVEDESEEEKSEEKGEGDESVEDKTEESEEKSEEDEKSEDDESEDETDEEEDEEKKPAKKPAKDEQRIPKSRFDEVNARRKAAEDELAQLKAQQKARDEAGAKKFDFDKAEEDYLQLALDGKIKEATALRKTINAAQEAEWEAKQQQTAASTVDQKATKRELDELVVQFENDYDVLNPNSEEYSADVVDDALAMYNGYLNTRKELTPAEAFKLAVSNTVKIYGLKKNGEEPEKEEPKPTTRIKEKKDVKGKLAKAKAAPKDPAKAGGDSGAGKGEQELDIEQMTDEEYDALPESTRRRMRGDVL